MNSVVKVLAAVSAGIVGFGVVGVSGAQAQDTTLPVEKPFRVKIGGYFPTDGDAKDAFGKNFLAGGISYDFSKTSATTPVIYNGYIDYTNKSRTVSGIKSEFGLLGIGVAARFLFAPATGTAGQPYGELGLGYYSARVKVAGDSETKGRFGGKAVLGYQLSMGVFGEFEYDVISKIEGFDPSGLRASIGYRF